jgi:protocatechuate 3,4-dioxygenase beta subunit
LTLALTNSAGAKVTSISNGAPATLKATLKNAAGAVIPNAIVTFSTDGTLATITPTATALTDASGVATATLSTATISSAGATTVNATAQVGSDAISGSVGFTVGTATVTVTAPVLGVGAAALSAFGTTSITVTVSSGTPPIPVTTPQNVTFSSTCANIGKAVLSTGVATVNGTAIGSYRDNGCAATDVITASAAGVTSAPTSLVVTPPTIGSIQFVSASPGIMSLKGIGGTEASLVTFKVLDPSGKPLSGKTVTFDLSTKAGGVRLTPSDAQGQGSAISDANGLVVITVNSGTVSTPIRVTASIVDTSTTPATTLTTQSSGLTVSTGIPDQDSLSLSATKVFVEDGNADGATTVLTARLADHFNNPVPDGTVVNFITTGGVITASCSTKDSLCNSTLTVQDPRPANGRVTVLAYAVGEESFIDRNGNGIADLASEMFDINGNSTDMGEAYIESNGTAGYQIGEFFLDFNNNGTWDGPDGLYSGVLCNSATSSLCPAGTPKTIHARQSRMIVFSDSTAIVTRITPAALPIDLGSCPGASSVTVRVVDKNGNPMPTGTTITFNGGGGVAVADPGSFTQDNNGATDYTVNINDSARVDVNGQVDCGAGSGAITITVKTPAGVTTAPATSYSVKLY